MNTIDSKNKGFSEPISNNNGLHHLLKNGSKSQTRTPKFTIPSRLKEHYKKGYSDAPAAESVGALQNAVQPDQCRR